MGLHVQERFFGQPRKFGTWWEGSVEQSIASGFFQPPPGVEECYVHSLGVTEDVWPNFGGLAFYRQENLEADLAMFDLVQRGEQWRTLTDPNLVAALARLINEVTDQFRQGKMTSLPEHVLNKLLPSAYLGWAGPGLTLPIWLRRHDGLHWKHSGAGDIAEQVNRFAGKIRIGYLYKRADPQ